MSRAAGAPGDRSPVATALFVALLIAGAWLRLTDLERRPMHGDEAVGASLSADVAQTGSFVYESANRHGPFQYFMSGLVMRWMGDSTSWVRFPYALIGSLLVLALLPLRRILGDAGWLFACSLATFSPMLVYYSRYAIQEILFVVATALMLSCAAAFARAGRGIALFGALLAAGWMVTLKETFVIVWGCLAAAALVGLLAGGPRSRAALARAAGALQARWRWGALGTACGALLAVALYSDLFRESSGLARLRLNLLDAMRHGATTAAAVELHRHPAAFYASLLVRFEWMALAGTLAGLIVAVRSRRPFSIVLGLYCLLSVALHFALAYKTPWLLLTPLLGMALLAGDGLGSLLSRMPSLSPARRSWAAALLPLLLLSGTLRSSFERPVDPALGLAYHHAGEEQVALAREISRIIASAPEVGYPKAIVALPYYWPLAWYLRNETDVLFESTPVPEVFAENLEEVPVVVTLESADPKFLAAFVPSGVPSFSLPRHGVRRVILIPPDYMVGRVWVREETAAR